jgi:hypothetical protein
MSVPHGAGGLVGSVKDLAKWANALHHGHVINPSIYAAMTTPAVLPGGRIVPYGFGVAFGEVRSRNTIEHGGGIFGFRTQSIYIPSDDVFVAVLSNSHNRDAQTELVARRLAALAIGQPYRAFVHTAVDPSTIAPLLGTYRIQASGETRRFFSREGRLYTLRDGSAETEVFAGGGDSFFYPSSLNWFQVKRRPDGTHVMEMHQDGSDVAELAMRIVSSPRSR